MPLRSLKAGEPITEDWIADLVDAVAQALTVRPGGVGGGRAAPGGAWDAPQRGVARGRPLACVSRRGVA